MMVLALSRPARSRAATATASSPARGSGTRTGARYPGAAGSSRRTTSFKPLPEPAQAVSSNGIESTVASRGARRAFLESFLQVTDDLLVGGVARRSLGKDGAGVRRGVLG